MENLGEIRSKIKDMIDELMQSQQLSYVEACMQFACQTYALEAQSLYKIVATCFVDYYIELVYKRENSLYQQDLIPQQSKHDYNRLKGLEEITDVFQLWIADPGCFVSAINACYQSQERKNNQELQHCLNAYDQMYLEKIVGSIPRGTEFQKRKDEKYGKCTL